MPKQNVSVLERQIHHYRHKISGPLLDRMDIFVEVTRLRYDEVAGHGTGEPSAAIAKRVAGARQRQQQRLQAAGLSCNAQMAPQHIQNFVSPMRQDVICCVMPHAITLKCPWL